MRLCMTMTKTAAVLAGIGLLALPGCYRGNEAERADEGESETQGDSGDPSEIFGECDESEALSATPMHRLSRLEYRNTVRALLEDFDESTRSQIDQGLEPMFAMLPADAREAFGETRVVGAVFDGMDHTLSQVHVDRYYDIGRALSQQVLGQPPRIAIFVGACATDGEPGNDESCVRDFAARIGARIFRRPLSEAELSFFVDTVYADEGPVGAFDPNGASDLLVTMLMSPQFLYHMEDSGTEHEALSGVLRLSAHELASRMSYLMWMAPPDATLRAAADDGSLLEPEVYASQVDRLLADSRAQAAFDSFFSQWLHLDDVVDPSLSVGDPAFDAFAGPDVPSPELRDAMIQEVLDLTRSVLWSGEQSFESLLTSTESFARTEELAALYGVETWSPGQTPPRLPSDERSGLLTRAALLVNASPRTRPIIKGHRIFEELRCQTLPLPPNNVSNEVDLPPPFTSRQRVEALTEQEGSGCADCHQYFNGYGYATEAYDALGRFRGEEIVYDTDGNELGRLSVDTNAEIVVGDEIITVRNGVELSAALATAPEVQACFARHYFRFVYDRVEDAELDACLIDDLTTQLTEGVPLRQALRSVALQPAFLLRKTED